MSNNINTPDVGIKNATVLKEDLPAFNANNLGYFVRYRVVSNDKNRYSHWSPYYFLLKGEIQDVPCAVTVSGTSPKAVSLVWQHPKVSADSQEISIFKEYDIYLKTSLSNDKWLYISSSSSTQFSTLLPSGITWFMVAVQVPVYPKTYSSDAAVFTSAQTSV
jgi:hypothetical protein